MSISGRHISYFGPEANDFGLLEQTFIEYGQSGKGKSRKYLHTYDEAVPWNQVPGKGLSTVLHGNVTSFAYMQYINVLL